MKHKAPATSVVPGPVGKLLVVTEGEGDLPVLFLHENAGDHTHWAEAQHGLESRTLALDLRGLGDSGGGHGPFGVEAGVEDVAAVADALLPQRFVLVGHGFGAAVASGFAAYYPERLAGLLYVEARGDLRQTPAKERESWIDHFKIEHYGAFHEHLFSPLLLEATPATRTLVMKTLRTSRREAIAGNFESLYHHDPEEAFASFTGPTHALASKVGPETLVGQRPALSRSMAPKTGHWLMLDAPKWFHTQLVHFLGECRHKH